MPAPKTPFLSYNREGSPVVIDEEKEHESSNLKAANGILMETQNVNEIFSGGV